MSIYSVIDQRAERTLTSVKNEIFNNESLQQYASKQKITSIEMTHILQNKWMGRIYIHQWRIKIKAMQPHQQELIRLIYIKNHTLFDGYSSTTISERIQEHKEWKHILSVIDFEKFEFFYNEEEQVWEFIIWPNFADYIWILIPPIRYCRKPSSTETEAMHSLVKLLRHSLDRIQEKQEIEIH